jgi:hypothetical protein
MSRYATRALDAGTWDAFAWLCEKHNGVWGGCWCTWFHPHDAEYRSFGSGYAGGRAYKEHLVREGRTHAARRYSQNSSRLRRAPVSASACREAATAA